MNKISLLLAGLALAVAAPGFAATAAEEPPGRGGDLGCVLRIAIQVADAGKAADDTSASDAEREQSRLLQHSLLEEEAYFLGRLSTREGGEQRRLDTASLYKAFRAQSANEQAQEAAACSKWSRDRQVETLQTLKSKPQA